MKKVFLILLFIIYFSFPSCAKTCFIGDSRTVGMHQIVEDNNIWYCKVGEGYNYFTRTCLPAINENKDSIDIIVYLFGVNDLYNKEKYVNTINELAENINAKIYFVSVNPVEDSKSKYVKNKDIIEFNTYCQKYLNDKVCYIDTFNTIEFKTTDGVHYDKSTYIQLYNRLYYETCGR